MATAPTQSQIAEQSNEQVGGRDRHSPEDGYSWKKYGQKFIQSKRKTRSYFKCRRPSCTAKKKVEWPPSNPSDKTVTCEGEHNHPPGPQSSSSQQNPTMNEYNLLSQVRGPQQ